MNCKEFSNLLDAWETGALPEEAAARMRGHEAACASCAMLRALRQDCARADGEVQVPASFSAAWRQQIKEEKKMESQEKRRIVVSRPLGWIAAAAALVFLVGGTLLTREDTRRAPAAAERTSYKASFRAKSTSVGNQALSLSDGAVYADYEMAAEEAAAPRAAAGAAQKETAEKIIRTASFTIRTTAFEADLQALQDWTRQMDGRIDYLSASGDGASGQLRSASLTLRIPASRLDGFLNGAKEIGHVTSLTQGMEDVSESYYDLQTRLETQQKKLDRLQEMIGKAKNVSELIEIESAIAEAQYAIDRYTSQLKSYDGKIEYSTVKVSLREVKEEEAVDVSLGQRIWLGLRSSLENGWDFVQDMMVFLVSALPWLAAIGLVCTGIWLWIKNRKKKGEKKQ